MAITKKDFTRESTGSKEADNSGQKTPPLLAFHTLFNEEFTGDTAEDIVQALYESSHSGMDGISFEGWWDYQMRLWRHKYLLSAPARDTPGACDKLLKIMVRAGALEEGPLPAKSSAAVSLAPGTKRGMNG